MNKLYFSLKILFLVFASNAQSTITIGAGSSTQGAPVSRFFRYHASEMIYLQSEINHSGTIESIAFNKQSGTDNNPIQNVEIYMRHTTQMVLTGGTTSTADYTLVYAGNYTNNAATGWMEVQLNTPFDYNNSDHLQILIIKGNQNPLTSAQFPRYSFTTSTPNRIRSYNDDSIPWSETRNMSSSASLPNIQLTIQENCEPTFATLNEIACESFTLNGETYSTSGTYTQVLQNSAGCDSTITLNLSITEINTEVIILGVSMVAPEQNNASYQWINCDNNTDISGATNAVFMPQANGVYQVRISIGDCVEESECVAFNVLNLESFQNNQIGVYPNPATETIWIHNIKAGTMLTVQNLEGKTLMNSFELNAGEHELSLESLESGVYVLHLDGKDYRQTIRIIKR